MPKISLLNILSIARTVTSPGLSADTSPFSDTDAYERENRHRWSPLSPSPLISEKTSESKMAQESGPSSYFASRRSLSPVFISSGFTWKTRSVP